MSEERKAVVHENELEAMKDSRKRDLPVFAMGGEKPFWIVAVSDHQARLALVDNIWPLVKQTKKERDERYTELLEEAMKAMADTTSGGSGEDFSPME